MCDECHAAEEIRYDASISDPAINPCPKPKGGWQLGWSPPCEPQL
jgi:hypothetical protein